MPTDVIETKPLTGVINLKYERKTVAILETRKNKERLHAGKFYHSDIRYDGHLPESIIISLKPVCNNGGTVVPITYDFRKDEYQQLDFTGPEPVIDFFFSPIDEYGKAPIDIFENPNVVSRRAGKIAREVCGEVTKDLKKTLKEIREMFKLGN